MQVEFEFVEGSVTIYRDGEVVWIQPFNPETGQPFASATEAEAFFNSVVDQIVPPEYTSETLVSSTSSQGFLEKVFNFLTGGTSSTTTSTTSSSTAA